MKSMLPRSRLMPLVAATSCLGSWCASAAETTSQAAQSTAQQASIAVTHLVPLAPGESGSTPWSFSPAWFVLLAFGVPAMAWLGLAWKRALHEDPHRLRRSGVKELRRLLAQVRRSRSSPRPLDLHGWCRAAARTWGVWVAAPTGREVTQSLRTLTGDGDLSTTWRDLWSATERGLYAPEAVSPSDWLERTSSAAAQVDIPARQHWLPNRLRHWFPTLSVVMFAIACVMTGAVHAEQPQQSVATNMTAAAVSRLKEAQPAAQQALRANWNDWAAHYTVAAYQIEQGQWDLAVAHASAAFLQHPSLAATRDNLRFALQQTGTMDPTLRRLLYGAWYQRIPALLSPAGWQRLALSASVILAAGFIAIVFSVYVSKHIVSRRYILSGARTAIAAGAALLITSVMAWNAYGTLNRPNAGVLLQAINLSPLPTDLVTEQETSPLFAGSVVLPHHSFLGWRQITFGDNAPGWVRANAVMPFYASRAN